MSRPDVPIYSRVPGMYWPRTASWSDEVKLGGLFVLTCPHRTMEGIYRLPISYMAADLRWTVKKVSRVIASLTEEGFLRFDSKTNVMLIVDALKIQAPENENQAKSCLRRIANLPKTDLFAEFLLLAKQHCFRKGASAYSQAFYSLLEQQLTKQLGEQLHPLNLLSSSPTQPKAEISNLQSRLNGDGEEGDFCLSLDDAEVKRKEAEIRKRFPSYGEVGR